MMIMIAVTTTILDGGTCGGHWKFTIMMRMIRGGSIGGGGCTWMGIFHHDFF